MPTKTLERRPQHIPRRGGPSVTGDPVYLGELPTPLAAPVTLRRSNHPPIPALPAPDDLDDPAAGLTSAERQAARRQAVGHSRTRRVVGDIVVFGLIALVLWFTWPVRFGGATTFVVVHGHSMDPTFRSGDLVVVRKTNHYRVGDIAAYHVPEGQAGAGSGVIHRIVRREGDRFVFKGDNRATEDQWRPRASDIQGKFAVRLPLPGEKFWALLPWVWCVLVGVVVVWMFWPPRETRRGRGSAT